MTWKMFRTRKKERINTERKRKQLHEAVVIPNQMYNCRTFKRKKNLKGPKSSTANNSRKATGIHWPIFCDHFQDLVSHRAIGSKDKHGNYSPTYCKEKKSKVASVECLKIIKSDMFRHSTQRTGQKPWCYCLIVVVLVAALCFSLFMSL